MTGQTHPILRQLTTNEIKTLREAGCRAEDWGMLQVGKDFDVSKVTATEFYGKNFLLNCNGKGGLFNSRIENCTISCNTLIRNTGLISNYDIGEDCVIENCASIRMDGESSFGNGVIVNVHNEAGGRQVPIYEQLTAQMAYILCFYRHYKNSDLVNRVIKNIKHTYTATGRGRIGNLCRLNGCGEIINVNIRPKSVLNGAILLENGTIGNDENYIDKKHTQAIIGNGVIARNFIIFGNCHVHSSAIIENCFIGEAVEIGKQFSAQDCLIFNNSQLFHGEACSVFAGPFTVSHHKSTLLIGGTFSFYNAGSGTNQSNHLYKSGPRHSGILERGCKTASGSYLMWPVRAGAFTVILGKHCTHFDTTNLPFSYIIEKNGCSFIKPAANLTSYGTFRDINKWEHRDKRSLNMDIVDFDISNPYILQKLSNAITLLTTLKSKFSDSASNIVLQQDGRVPAPYKHLYITKNDLERASTLYRLALNAFSVDAVERISCKKNLDLSQLKEEIANSQYTSPECNWADIAGMFIPTTKIRETLDDVTNYSPTDNKQDNCLNQIEQCIFEWHTQSSNISDLAATNIFINTNNINTQDRFLTTIAEAKRAKQILEQLITDDKEAENLEFAKIGFGIDEICDKEQDYNATMDDIFGIKK